MEDHSEPETSTTSKEEVRIGSKRVDAVSIILLALFAISASGSIFKVNGWPSQLAIPFVLLFGISALIRWMHRSLPIQNVVSAIVGLLLLCLIRQILFVAPNNGTEAIFQKTVASSLLESVYIVLVLTASYGASRWLIYFWSKAKTGRGFQVIGASIVLAWLGIYPIFQTGESILVARSIGTLLFCGVGILILFPWTLDKRTMRPLAIGIEPLLIWVGCTIMAHCGKFRLWP